jgi:flagellar basal body rod protein FlgC
MPQARGRSGTAPSLEQASVDSLLAQRAFEANLRSFQAADQQLGDTLDLLA